MIRDKRALCNRTSSLRLCVRAKWAVLATDSERFAPWQNFTGSLAYISSGNSA
jgi:hypothetical protein